MKVSRITVSLTTLLVILVCIFSTNGSAENPQQQAVLSPHDGPSHGIQADQVAQLETTEKFTFQTEISRLMSLIINSLYKTREIFLREIISNASDALDKIRFLSLTDPSALESEPRLSISIAADPETKSLIITDTGIGMTREQLKMNLGTIAKSGTSEFLQKLESNKDEVTQIGQFGVGFYSVFLVADKVTVASKSNDEADQYIWMSEAVDDFVIAKDPRGNTLGRGTEITLHLKEDALEFLDQDVLKGLVTKYSEFINFPIYIWTERNETVTKGSGKVDSDKDEEEIHEESLDKEEEDDESESETETRTTRSWERVNTQKPIWMRSAKDISEEEYVQFYQSLTKSPTEKPLTWMHYKGEGDIEFRSIVYIPKQADPNFFRNLADKLHNMKLFVKRVFITDEFELFPKWLSFLKGIVDADDLPLNVSRETLQKHRSLRIISKHLVKKALDMFSQLSKQDEEKYAEFLKEYGNALKYGAIESDAHRRKIATLLRFASSYDPTSPGVSLDSYIDRMKANQKSIYYLAGLAISEIEQSPFLERLLARGFEVLYLVDPIDEMLIQHMPSYNGKMFVNVAKGDLKFGDEKDEEADIKELEKKFEPLSQWLKTTLGQHIDKVVLSKRLTTSPMAIVAADFGLTGHMERLMAAQGEKNKERDMMLNFMSMQKKTLEINPNHPIVKTLLERVEADDTDQDTTEMVTILYETTAIRSGYPLKDLNSFTKRIESVIRKGIGASLTEQVEVKEEVAADKTAEEKLEDEALQKEANEDEQDDNDTAEEDLLHDEL
ncbi:Hsp90 protein-domain-containing protein [Radiomyces spectabilis]|uniref:Hsp90 protein-domain-containing protein n=1 Tax=Radiomyces spectabilis TaxID=64574 RepID=UPI002220AB02|nr:Hsp90 protein-domain-containing protein [Radiomyces spectabilis]KAI8369541.1 Hsp90 protein-domain-containing protein [Radiomyces spectabilis]